MTIKEYAEEVLILLAPLEDTIPEKIKANRSIGECRIGECQIKGLGLIYAKRPRMIGNETEKEFLKLVDEWFHYFDTGYRAPHRIDDLPRLIREKGLEIIKEV